MRASNYRRRGVKDPTSEPVAGNGLLNRRMLLGRGAMLAGAIGAGPLGSLTGAAAEPPAGGALTDPPWSLEPGATIEPYQRPSRFEKDVVRTLSNPNGLAGHPGARTPHHLLNGTITPNGLHFVVVAWRRSRHRSGQAPTGDPRPGEAAAGLHPRRARPISDGDARDLPRMRRQQRAAVFARAAAGQRAGAARLVSCAEWTGVKLSTLLDETGVDPKAKWFIAEGADAPHLSRSVPLKKASDDAMIALYQNGERLMPANGYPMRLLLPGYEGNMNVKYLRRIKLVEEPAMSYLRDPRPTRSYCRTARPTSFISCRRSSRSSPSPRPG